MMFWLNKRRTPSDELLATMSLKPKRRWLRISLRSVLLIVLAISLPLGWFVNRVHRQRALVAALEKMGCEIEYEQAQHIPTWLLDLFGKDFLLNVTRVDAEISNLDDAGMAHLQTIRRLQCVFLNGTAVSQAGVDRLKRTFPDLYVAVAK